MEIFNKPRCHTLFPFLLKKIQKLKTSVILPKFQLLLIIKAIHFLKNYKSDLWFYVINKSLKVQSKGSTPKCKLN